MKQGPKMIVGLVCFIALVAMFFVVKPWETGGKEAGEAGLNLLAAAAMLPLLGCVLWAFSTKSE